MTPPEHSSASTTSADAWLRAVGGPAGLVALRRRTLDGIVVDPIYGRLQGGPPASAPGRTDPSGWQLRPLYADANVDTLRAAIADDLGAGVSSIALKLATPGEFGCPMRHDFMATALSGVTLEQVEVVLLAGDQYFGAAQSLLTQWEDGGRSIKDLRASVLADPLGVLARTGALEAGLWPSLELLGQFVAANVEAMPEVRLLLADGALYHDAGASEAQELAAMLATVLEYCRVLDFDGVPPARVFRHLTVGLAADSDLFATIAKLRAARLLLAQIANEVGAGDARAQLRLWVTTSQRMQTATALHTNILRNAVAAVAAVVGGADVITALPHTWSVGSPDRTARRLARNTQLLMTEESGLARVLDPAAGSGYVASLTDALAQRAWELFQEIEAAGGMAKALLSGKIQEGIADMAARREAQLAEGSLAITGVTVFAGEAEEAAQPLPHPSPTPIEQALTRVAALPVRHLAGAGGSGSR